MIKIPGWWFGKKPRLVVESEKVCDHVWETYPQEIGAGAYVIKKICRYCRTIKPKPGE